MSEAQAINHERGVEPDLTAFQQNILAILAEESRDGLAIKREVESYYGSEVNNGRLYPNLDDLVNEGLVDKSDLDKRTNQYGLTEKGRQAILGRAGWILSKHVTDDSRASDVFRADRRIGETSTTIGPDSSQCGTVRSNGSLFGVFSEGEDGHVGGPHNPLSD
jgi:DNA-binding PadR family transcriptional regulator